MPPKKGAKTPKHLIEEEQQPKNDLTALVMHIQEYPAYYAAAAAFIVVCLIAGVLYAAHINVRDQRLAADYMRALDAEEPAQQVAMLAELTDRPGGLRDEIHYMLGERAFAIGDYEQAREAFTAVRERFSGSPFAPDATEGLGFVLEDADGDYEGAKAFYQEIIDRWPDSFAAIRQPLNIGRCQEELGQIEEAIASYQDQINVFPDSHIARRAQRALDRLRDSHPELFPEEIPDEPTIDELKPVESEPEVISEPDEELPVEEPEEEPIAEPEEEPVEDVEDEPVEEDERPGLRLQLPDSDEILFDEEDEGIGDPFGISPGALELPDEPGLVE